MFKFTFLYPIRKITIKTFGYFLSSELFHILIYISQQKNKYEQFSFKYWQTCLHLYQFPLSFFETEYLPYFSKMVSSNRLIIKTYFSFGNSYWKNFFVFCSLDSNPKPYRLWTSLMSLSIINYAIFAFLYNDLLSLCFLNPMSYCDITFI